jgi:uncharacterized membrane protein YdjX (TVP38/TMEM64 family)
MHVVSKHARLALTVVILVVVSVLVRTSGLSSWLNPDHIQQLVESAGPWGPLAFMVVFIGAVVSQVPGLIFVAVAPALFRLPEAWALSFVASNLAVILNFELVRRLGGQPLAQLENARLRRLFERLESEPVKTVALLRTITVMFPPVTSALALTSLRSRDHVLGSLLGMLLPVTLLLMASSVFWQR